MIFMVNERYDKYKDKYKAYRDNNKEKIKELTINWKKRNKTKVDIINRKYFNKKGFGGIRDMILERDNWACVMCGMTNEQHILLFGRIITVDHIDGNRNNNIKENLQTLCLRCHSTKDNKRRRNKNE